MRIVITGGTGHIGGLLRDHWAKKGHSLVLLSRQRDFRSEECAVHHWNPLKGLIDHSAFKEASAVVHLCGAAVAGGRWTRKRRQLLWRSRVDATRLLVRHLLTQPKLPDVVIAASAIGYYGCRGEAVDESAPAGEDFLAQLTAAWEREALPLKKTNIRLVHLRLGLVLGPTKGIFPKIYHPLRLGVGTVLGSGRQWVSWIHEKDVVNAFDTALQSDTWAGTYNLVAPESVSYRTFLSTLARLSGHRIRLPAVPSWLLRVALGDMSDIVLQGRQILPTRIEKTQFSFCYPTWKRACEQLLLHKN